MAVSSLDHRVNRVKLSANLLSGNDMKRLTIYVLPITLLLPTVAMADLTALDVWENFQSYGKGFGSEYTGNIESNGTTLTVHDFTMTPAALSNGILAGETVFPEVIFEATRAGDVLITVPQVGTSTTQGLGPNMAHTSLSVAFTGTLRASGSKDHVIYTFDGNDYIFEQSDVIDADLPVFKIALSGLSGEVLSYQSDDMVHMDIDLSARELASVIQQDDVETISSTEISYTAGPIAVTGSSQNNVAVNAAAQDTLATLKTNIEYNLADSTFDMNIGTPEQTVHSVTTAEATTLSVDMASGMFSYLLSSTGIEAKLDGSAIPFPQVDFGIEAAHFAMSMPYTNSDTPISASLKLGIDKLRVPEIAWAILDPENTLPHDPADIRLDISGTALSDINLLDPSSLTSVMPNSAPITPIDASLNELYLSFAGAALSGTGTATFAQDGSTMQKGLPAADAQAHLELSGSSALLDALRGAGIISPQIVVTVQTMIALFSTPTGAPDAVETDLALSQDGAFTVNGMPLPF
jgi:hypothetical protein